MGCRRRGRSGRRRGSGGNNLDHDLERDPVGDLVNNLVNNLVDGLANALRYDLDDDEPRVISTGEEGTNHANGPILSSSG